MQAATVFDNRTKAEHTLEVDSVLVNIGFVNSLGPIKDWGLEIEGSQIKVDGTMRTNRPRIFAAGDICTYPGKLKLIATGFGEACIAANYAKHALDPAFAYLPGSQLDDEEVSDSSAPCSAAGHARRLTAEQTFNL